MRWWVRSLALLSGLTIRCCCELWCRVVATALTRPLAWEPPYAAGAALEIAKKDKKKTKKKTKKKAAGELISSLGSRIKHHGAGI